MHASSLNKMFTSYIMLDRVRHPSKPFLTLLHITHTGSPRFKNNLLITSSEPEFTSHQSYCDVPFLMHRFRIWSQLEIAKLTASYTSAFEFYFLLLAGSIYSVHKAQLIRLSSIQIVMERNRNWHNAFVLTINCRFCLKGQGIGPVTLAWLNQLKQHHHPGQSLVVTTWLATPSRRS